MINFTPAKLSSYFFLLFFACSISMQAQQKQIELYVAKGKRSMRNMDSLLYFSNKLIQINDSTAKAEGYYLKALAWQRQRITDSTLAAYQEAEKFVPERNQELLGRIYQGFGTYYLMQKNPAKVMDYAILQENIAREINNERLLTSALSKKSIAFMEMGNLEASIKPLLESAKIEETLEPNQLPATYGNISTAYRKLNRPEMELKWIQTSLKAARSHSNPVFMFGSLQRLADFYERSKRTDSARFYANEILALPNLFLDQQVATQLTMTRIALAENNIAAAEQAFQKANSIPLKGNFIGLKSGMPFIEQKILRKKGEYAAAEKILDSLTKAASARSAGGITYPYLLEKAELYQEQGKYEEAYTAFTEYTRIKDSLTATNDLAIIQRAANEYDLENKEKAIEEALEKNKASQTTIVVLVIGSLLVILAMGLVYRKLLNSKLRVDDLEVKNKEITASFQKLQQQLSYLKQEEVSSSILVNSKQVVKLDQLEYVKSEGHYLDYFVINEKLPITERSALKDRIAELESSGFLQVHRSFVINIEKVKSIQSGLVIMDTGIQIPLSRTFKQRLKDERHPLFA